MINIANLFQKSLIRRMEERGLSQQDVAALSGVPRSNVSRYRNGQSEPGLTHASNIAEAFGLSLDEFLGARPTPPVPVPVKAPISEGIRAVIREELGVPDSIRPLLPRLSALDHDKQRFIADQLTALIDTLEAIPGESGGQVPKGDRQRSKR